MSIKRKVLINSSSNFIARFGINIISFFTLPLFIKHFGDHKYAIFILINTIVESVAFLDFGIGTSLGKKAAEFTINQDNQKFKVYFNWTFWFTIIISLFSSVVLFFSAPYLVGIFKVENTLYDDGIFAFHIASIYLLFFFVLKIYQALLEGFEKFLVVNIFRIFQYFSVIISVLFVIYGRLSFHQFLYISIAGNLLPYLFYAIYFHLNNRMEIQFEIGIKGLFKSEYWQMSKNFFVIQVTNFLFSLSDRFIISIILGATSVVYYSVVTKISYIVRMVNNQTLLVINPLITKAREGNNTVLLSNIIKKGAVFQFILMLPFITTAALFLRGFLKLWIGGEYVTYAHWGVLALVIYLLGPFSAMVQRVLIYGGFEGIVKNITFKLVLVNIAISIIFTYVFGIGGVIIGSVTQSIISIPIFRRKAKELLGIEYSVFSKESAVSVLITGLFIAAFFVFHVENLVTTWKLFLILSISFFIVQMMYPVYRVFIKK